MRLQTGPASWGGLMWRSSTKTLGSPAAVLPAPGFERLLGALCDGKVGAVLSIEVSRLARNGRDWHTLLQFCSVVGALLIDANNIYDPTQINDALLLGIKGTISEMEVATFRQRAQSALQNMAKRGELFRRIAIGYVRGPGNRIDKDPDERVRAALELAFRKFAELGSARQLYFWLSEQQIKMPAVSGAGNEQKVIWKLPRYHTVLSLLQNPVYAGAYAYGRSKTAVHLHQGRKRTVRQKHPQREQWSVLIPDHHEGYISWETFNSNLKMIAHNANGKGDLVRGSVKRGGALLSGILRCGHCGAKLLAQYPGPAVIRYQCSSYTLDRETRCCVSFGGLRVDNMVADQVLEYLKPLGIEASMRAIESLQGDEDERVHQKRLAVEQARYEVGRAQRQYDAVDPLNRLVAGELERRWNQALQFQSQLEQELAALQREPTDALSDAVRAELLALGVDVRRLWDHPKSPPEFKKRILRSVLKEIIVSSHGDTLRFVLHWQGGDHTEMPLEKTRTGKHRYIMDTDTIELIRALARIQADSMIASVLNRIGRRTAHGERWNAKRVCAARHNHSIDVYREGERQTRGELTVSEVAGMLRVTETTVLRMIRKKQLLATQACFNAPWILLKAHVEKYIAASRQREFPQTSNPNQIALDIQ